MSLSFRVQRVSDEIKRLLSLLLISEVNDRRLKHVCITDVSLSRDFSYAKVFITCMNHEISSKDIDSVLYLLRGMSKFFRYNISKKIRLYSVPRFSFLYDYSSSNGSKIDCLIKKAKDSDLT